MPKKRPSNANISSPSKSETSIKTHAFSIVSTEPTYHLTHSEPPLHTTLDLFIVNHIENYIHFSKSISPFEALSAFTFRYQNFIINGDLNANISSPSKSETSINNHAFSIVSTETNYHLTPSEPPLHTTLDLFIVNHIENDIHFSKSISPFKAGRDYIHLILNIDTPKPPPKNILSRNLNNVNLARLH